MPFKFSEILAQVSAGSIVADILCTNYVTTLKVLLLLLCAWPCWELPDPTNYGGEPSQKCHPPAICALSRSRVDVPSFLGLQFPVDGHGELLQFLPPSPPDLTLVDTMDLNSSNKTSLQNKPCCYLDITIFGKELGCNTDLSVGTIHCSLVPPYSRSVTSSNSRATKIRPVRYIS